MGTDAGKGFGVDSLVTWIVMGMTLGVGLGIALGAAIDSIGIGVGVAMGVSIGSGLGAAIGVAFGQNSKTNERRPNAEVTILRIDYFDHDRIVAWISIQPIKSPLELSHRRDERTKQPLRFQSKIARVRPNF